MCRPVERKIIHIDMDAFFASVEQRDNPELRGKPVAVGGSPDGRGVVAAASYEARKFGVRSAISASRAKQLCRNLIFVHPNFQKYKDVSKQIRKIFDEITDLVEPLSLDEAYLDVTANKLNEPSATKIARYIRARIRGQTNLTASAGVASTKLLAKIASDWKKPDGLFVIPPENAQDFLDSLPIEKLWSVGPATAKKLHAFGIETVRQLKSHDRFDMERRLGKHGHFLWNLAHGKDERAVSSHRIAKSRGCETTFPEDVICKEYLEQTVEQLCEKSSKALEKLDQSAKTITLKIRYASFHTISRSKTVSSAIRTPDELSIVAKDLLKEIPGLGQTPVRLVGISTKNFEGLEEDSGQLDLF